MSTIKMNLGEYEDQRSLLPNFLLIHREKKSLFLVNPRLYRILTITYLTSKGLNCKFLCTLVLFNKISYISKKQVSKVLFFL